MTKKKEQKKLAIKNFFNRILIFILSFVSAILLAYFFAFPSLINRDIESKNILIVSDKLNVHSNYIYLAHISDNADNNIIVSFPAKEVVLVPGGYGEYPLQSVYQLLKIDKKDDQFITSTFSELLDISVDEIITVGDQLNEIEEDAFARFFFFRSLQDLTHLKFNKMYNSLYLHYKTKDIVLVKANSLESFEDHKNEFETISSILSQHCSVAVVNASGENGLARKVGNVIENTGAIVVRIDDVPDLQEETVIYYGSDPVDCKQLAQKVSGIFKVKPEFISIDKLENSQQYRAKVIVVVGK
jgi:hypothetical protein